MYALWGAPQRAPAAPPAARLACARAARQRTRRPPPASCAAAPQEDAGAGAGVDAAAGSKGGKGRRALLRAAGTASHTLGGEGASDSEAQTAAHCARWQLRLSRRGAAAAAARVRSLSWWRSCARGAGAHERPCCSLD
jgi:hypothetical protein